jgi:hypothetical protein
MKQSRTPITRLPVSLSGAQSRLQAGNQPDTIAKIHAPLGRNRPKGRLFIKSSTNGSAHPESLPAEGMGAWDRVFRLSVRSYCTTIGCGFE